MKLPRGHETLPLPLDRKRGSGKEAWAWLVSGASPGGPEAWADLASPYAQIQFAWAVLVPLAAQVFSHRTAGLTSSQAITIPSRS